MSKQPKMSAEQAEAIEKCRELFPKGSTVHTIVRSVAKSGMSRKISVHKLAPDFEEGKPVGVNAWAVSGWVAKALGRRLDRDTFAIVVQGCGMDMTFELVYSLAQALYGDGYSLKRECI